MSDKPRDRPTVPDVLPLVNAVYRRNPVGCCLYLMTENDNFEQGHAEFCLEQAIERDHADCRAAATLLVRMTTTQRRKVAATRRQKAEVSP